MQLFLLWALRTTPAGLCLHTLCLAIIFSPQVWLTILIQGAAACSYVCLYLFSPFFSFVWSNLFDGFPWLEGPCLASIFSLL